MNPLEELIKKEIEENGPITFKRFMELALYHPEFGYYTKGPSIGKSGDFFTSSSVGSLFGRTLAHALKEMLDVAGGMVLVEMGAGMGHLAKDILDEFDRNGWDVEYIINEKSPKLIEVQRKLLEGRKVKWGSSLKELSQVVGVFFSNELVDAFPVHLVEVKDGRLQEVYVDVKNGKFCEVLGPLSTEKIEEYFEIQQVKLPEGFRTEVNLEMFRWLEDVAEALERGFLVTIDYGYPKHEFYKPYRSRGTLMCYFKHQATENPYERVGEQDITAHVNFSALAAYGKRLGFEVVGFTNQANFLIDSGILELVNNTQEMLKVKTLVLPQGMGETFKVLVQKKGIEGKIFLRCLENAPKRASFSL